MKTALFLGRFQPFHRGHLDALKQVQKKCNVIKIAIGSSNEKRTDKNPLSYLERKKYIRSVLPLDDYRFYAIPDNKSDAVWLRKLKKIVGPFDNIFFTDNPWVEKIMQENKVPYQKTKQRIKISATDLRKMIRASDPKFKKFLVKPLPPYLRKIIEITKDYQSKNEHRIEIK